MNPADKGQDSLCSPGLGPRAARRRAKSQEGFWRGVCLSAESLQSCLTLRPHGLWPPRLLCPWDAPGKNAGRVACPPPGDLPDPGIEPASHTSPALAGRFFTASATWEALPTSGGGGRAIRHKPDKAGWGRCGAGSVLQGRKGNEHVST